MKSSILAKINRLRYLKLVIYWGIIVGLGFLMPHCDKGLNPLTQDTSITTGISGTLFMKNWPAQNSPKLQELRLVAFYDPYPPGNIITKVTERQAFMYPADPDTNVSLPFHVSFIDFVFELPPGNYQYIAVAQRFGSNRNGLSPDWQMVGHYALTLEGSNSAPILITEGQLLEKIDIQVDFDIPLPID